MAVVCKTTTLLGIKALPVNVETQIVSALRRFALVGLPDGVLREAKERVRCALENSGFAFPHREVIVSLAPASLPKKGSGFDLAIALGILAADGQVCRKELEAVWVLGELALDGRLKPSGGELAAAMLLRESGGGSLMTAAQTAGIAAKVEGVRVVPVQDLLEAVAVLRREITPAEPESTLVGAVGKAAPGFGDVVGQQGAKRALEISAAGGHALMMAGPPGAGKSMLASRLAGILPPLETEEALEVASIDFAASELRSGVLPPSWGLPQTRPFRSPHHTTSAAGLIGGGTHALPGEITLAHRGVLFLDEFPEFRRDVLEALREPLEAKRVSISRARIRVDYPSDFILVAAMNPCPCGLAGSPKCRCSPYELQRYRARISGPIADRIDLHLWVPAIAPADLFEMPKCDPTPKIRARVAAARDMQKERFGSRAKLNSAMGTKELSRHCEPDAEGRKLMIQAVERLSLTARGYTRVLKVARTIADLEGSSAVKTEHLMEALSYRRAL